MNYKKEFEKYAKSMGLPTKLVDDQINLSIENSMTPYILEERAMNVTQMDVFSRLLKDRIIWLSGPVNSYMCDVVQAQLMFLDNLDKCDIRLHINTPGGSVLSGLGIIDVMNYVSSDIHTVNTGMAASMGSVLLSSGTKGKRSSLLSSKVMTHQVSHGMQGNIQDTRITQLEGEKYNFMLFKILGENCGKTYQEVIEFSRRDRWYDSNEAIEFGLIDEVIGERNMVDMLEGFDEYYKNEVLLG